MSKATGAGEAFSGWQVISAINYRQAAGGPNEGVISLVELDHTTPVLYDFFSVAYSGDRL